MQGTPNGAQVRASSGGAVCVTCYTEEVACHPVQGFLVSCAILVDMGIYYTLVHMGIIGRRVVMRVDAMGRLGMAVIRHGAAVEGMRAGEL